MRRFLISFFVMTALVVGMVWIWALKRPMGYFDREYPLWKAKMDMAVNLPANSVVILGDSRIGAGLIPARLGPDVFNLAVYGSSSIESLAFARLVVSTPHPPRAIILSICSIRCMSENCFWDKGVRYGLVDWAAVQETRVRSRRYHDRVLNDLADKPIPSHFSPLFGPETPGDLDARIKSVLYCARFPWFNIESLTASHFFQREGVNFKSYHEVTDARGGHALEWGQNGSQELSPETTLTAFVPAPLLDSYLSDMISLFQSRNIPVYWVVCPLSDSSIAALHPEFADQYGDYIKTYEGRFPNFHQLGEPLPAMPWTDFGDASHLNRQGAEIFSDHVAVLLREAGIEK